MVEERLDVGLPYAADVGLGTIGSEVGQEILHHLPVPQRGPVALVQRRSLDPAPQEVAEENHLHPGSRGSLVNVEVDLGDLGSGGVSFGGSAGQVLPLHRQLQRLGAIGQLRRLGAAGAVGKGVGGVPVGRTALGVTVDTGHES